MLFEIRSYHYDPDQWDAYKPWARAEAIPYLKAHWDIVGFWFDNGEKPEFGGRDREPRKYGAANVTWIIRWQSMEQRNQAFKDLHGSEEWQKFGRPIRILTAIYTRKSGLPKKPNDSTGNRSPHLKPGRIVCLLPGGSQNG